MHSEVHTVPPGRGGRCDDSTHDLANLHMLIATARARSRPLRLDVTLGDRARVQSGSGSSQFELHAALDRAPEGTPFTPRHVGFHVGFLNVFGSKASLIQSGRVERGAVPLMIQVGGGCRVCMISLCVRVAFSLQTRLLADALPTELWLVETIEAAPTILSSACEAASARIERAFPLLLRAKGGHVVGLLEHNSGRLAKRRRRCDHTTEQSHAKRHGVASWRDIYTCKYSASFAHRYPAIARCPRDFLLQFRYLQVGEAQKGWKSGETHAQQYWKESDENDALHASEGRCLQHADSARRRSGGDKPRIMALDQHSPAAHLRPTMRGLAGGRRRCGHTGLSRFDCTCVPARSVSPAGASNGAREDS
jgi:hypothetical protein